MTYKSADDIRTEHEERMGPVLGRQYYEVYNELVWLNDKWREYTELFGTSEERIALLNKAASRFFGFLQHALFEDTLLHIARLTDSPKSGGHKTLTIRRLPSLIQDADFRDEVAGLVTVALEKTAFARDWRHKYIAHRNLPLALDEDGASLALASRGHVREGLDSLGHLLNCIHGHYVSGEVCFDVPGGPGDALDLLRVLRLGVDEEEARERRITAHQPLPGDLNYPAI